MKNKLHNLKVKIKRSKFFDQVHNNQKTVIIGLVLIILFSFLAYAFVLKPDFFSSEYSEPFRNWIISKEGITYTLLYFLTIVLFFILTSKRTRPYVSKLFSHFPKIKLPKPAFIKSKTTGRHSTEAVAKRKRRITHLVWIILILLPIVFYTFINQTNVKAGWWNDNWNYRKRVTISNSGGAQTDFQVAITVDTATLITDGKIQSDCDDIRILDYSTNTLITDPYWVETCNSSATKIWIKMSSVPTTDTIFYLYYGNPTAISQESRGEDVFKFFDGFDDAQIDSSKWSNTCSPTYCSITNGVFSLRSDGTNFKSLSLLTSVYDSSPTDLDTLEFRYNTSAVNRLHAYYEETNNRFAIHPYYEGFTGPRIQWRENGGTYNTKAQYATTGTGSWYVHRIDRTSSTAFTATTYNSAYSQLGTDNQSSSYWGSTTFAWSYAEQLNVTSNIDWVRIREYAATPPTASLGTEEIGPGPTAHWKFDEGYDTPYEMDIQKTEQYLNVFNGYYQPGILWNFEPTDNSLGIIHWDADKYPNATVYLELEYWENGLGVTQVGVYTTGGSSVYSTGLNEGGGVWQYQRVGPFSLTDETDYTIRLRSPDYYGNRYETRLRAARFVVVQSNTEGLTTTQLQAPVGNRESISSNTATQLTDKKIYYYDESKFSPTPSNVQFEATLKSARPTIEQQVNIIDQYYSDTSCVSGPLDNSLGLIEWDGTKYSNATIYFEAVLKATGTLGSAYAELRTEAGDLVTEISLIEGDWGIARSAPISLSTGTKYTVRLHKHCSWGSIAEMNSARIIVKQSDSTKITDTETQIEVGAYQTGITSTSSTELTDKKVYLYDQDQFSPTPESSGDVEFHASLKIDDSDDTMYAELYNQDAGQVVASVSHTGDTNWTLKSTTNVDGDSDWDTTNDDEYIVHVYCTDGGSDGCSGNIGNAKIVLDQSDSGGITDVEVIHHYNPWVKTDTDDTYSSMMFYNRYNRELTTSQVQFSGGVLNYFFEATLKTTSGGTAFARSSWTSNSEVSTTNLTYTRRRSSDITNSLPSWPSYYLTYDLDAQIKNSGSYTTSASTSWMIIQVSDLATSGVTAYADLYNLTDTTQVSGSEVSTTSIGWTNVRSSNITLTSGKEYVMRMRSSNNNIYTYAINGKILIPQSNSEGIAKLETLQPMVNSLRTYSDTGYTDQDQRTQYNATRFSNSFGNMAVYFEATMKTTVSTTGYTQLKNDSDGTAVSGSELATTEIDYDRVRTSSSILPNMPTAAKNMDTQIKNSTTSTTSVSSSWMVIQLNETAPSTAFDSVQNDNHGGIIGASWMGDENCIHGKCLDFNGTDNHVAIANNANTLSPGSGDMTITAWVKADVVDGQQRLIYTDYGSDTDNLAMIRITVDNKFQSYYRDGSANSAIPESTTIPEAGKWYHVAAVKDGTTSRIYVNGVEENSATNGSMGTITTSGGTVPMIGTYPLSPILYVWDGLIDDVKVYPYARSAAEITVDYNGGANVLGEQSEGMLLDNLATYWKFDETAENTCDDTNDACDSSGNNNHARWEDNATSTTGYFGNAVDFDGTNDRVATSSANEVPGVTYRQKPITITNSTSSELTNYQVKLTVTYDSDMQSDFDDLRFYNASEDPLDYWIESYVASTSATVWVEVDSLNANSNTIIYMRYGDSTATSESNSENTMIWYDNFTGAHSISDYTPAGLSGSWDLQTGNAKMVQHSNNYGAGSGSDLMTGVNAENFEIIVSVKSVDNDMMGVLYSFTSTSLFYSAQFSNNWGEVGSSIRENDTTGTILDSTSTRPNTTETAELKIRRWGDNIEYYQKGILILSATDSTHGSGNVGLMTNGNDEAEFHPPFIIRNYTSPEPTPAIGTEEIYLPTNSMTVSAWVNADTLGATDRVILARNNSDTYDWAIYNDSANPGKLEFTSDRGLNTGLSTTTLTTGKWYLVTMVVDNNTTKLYINGQPDKEISNNGLPGAGDISVGADPDGTDGWDGKIDDVRIYNKALSELEVDMLANWAPGPVAHYTFDEGTGTTTVYDHSGNGNDGTMTGSMTEDDWVKGMFDHALEFDGSDDFVDVGTGPSVVKSVSFWVYPKTSTEYFVDLNGTAYVWANSGTVTAAGFTTPTIYVDGVESTSLSADSWHHITVTTETVINASDFDMARIEGSGNLEGKLDEVKLYNYVLSQKKVIEDTNAGHPAPGSPVGSPIMYLKMDEGYGDTANDSSPQGNNGDLNGTCPGGANCPSWTNAGKIGKALDFDGGNDYASTTLASNEYTNFTYSVWFNSDDAGSIGNDWVAQRFITQRDGGTSSVTAIGINNNKLATYWDDGANQQGEGTTTLSPDTWYHGALTYDGSQLKLYLNGSLENSFNEASVVSGTSDTVILAQVNSSRYFDGTLDELKIYNFALSDSQIKQEFNQGKTAVFGATSTDSSGNPSWSGDRLYCPPGDNTSTCTPVAEWLMDEGTGTSVYDTSANNFTGSLTNSPEWVSGNNNWALEMNGSNQYVDAGTGPSSVKSVEFWVYPETTTEYFVNLTSTTDYIWANGGTITATGFSSPTVYVDGVQTTTISADKWHHVVVTTDTAENASDLDFGRTAGAYLQGKIDQIRLYDYALSSAQVAWNYNKGAPVGYWKLDECQGTTAYDSGSGENNGTITIGGTGDNTSAGTCLSGTGTEAWNNGTTGKRNASLDFDGTNDYISLDTKLFESLSSNDQTTVTMWVNIDSYAEHSLIYESASGHNNFAIKWPSSDSDTLEVNIGANTAQNSIKNNWLLDTWYHIGVTWSGSQIKIYVNGKLDNTIGSSDSLEAGTANTQIGRYLTGGPTDGGYTNGQIDEVKVFSYPLTPQQILNDYNQSAIRFGPATGSP